MTGPCDCLADRDPETRRPRYPHHPARDDDWAYKVLVRKLKTSTTGKRSDGAWDEAYLNDGAEVLGFIDDVAAAVRNLKHDYRLSITPRNGAAKVRVFHGVRPRPTLIRWASGVVV